MAILEISNCFLKLAQTHKKIEFFKNKFFSEFLLHYIALCSSQFFQNNFSTCFIFFWLIKLNLNLSVLSMTYVSKSLQDKIFIFCILQVLCTVNSIKRLEVASSLGSKDTNNFPSLEKPTITLNI